MAGENPFHGLSPEARERITQGISTIAGEQALRRQNVPSTEELRSLLRRELGNRNINVDAVSEQQLRRFGEDDRNFRPEELDMLEGMQEELRTDKFGNILNLTGSAAGLEELPDLDKVFSLTGASDERQERLKELRGVFETRFKEVQQLRFQPGSSQTRLSLLE